jgi:hypothetical protein
MRRLVSVVRRAGDIDNRRGGFARFRCGLGIGRGRFRATADIRNLVIDIILEFVGRP